MRERKKCVRGAPKYLSKRIRVCTFSFLRKFFKTHKEFKELRQKENFKEKFKEMQKAIRFFNEELFKVAIENRDGVKLPEGLGHIYLGSCIPKKTVNHALSNQLGRDIRYTNNNTDGKLLKISYTARSKSYNFENKTMWNFFASVGFRQAASKAFSENYQMYLSLASFDEIDKRQFAYYAKHNVDPDFVNTKRYKYT